MGANAHLVNLDRMRQQPLRCQDIFQLLTPTTIIHNTLMVFTSTEFKIRICTVFLLLLTFSPLQADQTLLIDDLNLDSYRFSVFNTYKYHLLLLSITQKNDSLFDCQSNRYVFYDYREEQYFEILAGNLKINSDYSRLFLTRIHNLLAMPEKPSEEWKGNVQKLLKEMNVSAQTLENGKSISNDNSVSCWQQPEVMDLETRITRSFPFLAANLCKNAWCSELYWTNLNSIQFWVQINPKQVHLIRLNTQTGTHEFIDKRSRFFRKQFIQMNAPRDNIITEENLAKGSFSLSSRKGHEIQLEWKRQSNDKLKIELVRSASNPKAAKTVLEKIRRLIEKRQYTEAFRQVKFGFWLSPDDTDLKVERLRIYASLLLVDNFLNSLSSDFNDNDRFDACQRLHLDSALRNLWKQKRFSDTFKEICFAKP